MISFGKLYSNSFYYFIKNFRAQMYEMNERLIKSHFPFHKILFAFCFVTRKTRVSSKQHIIRTCKTLRMQEFFSGVKMVCWTMKMIKNVQIHGFDTYSQSWPVILLPLALSIDLLISSCDGRTTALCMDLLLVLLADCVLPLLSLSSNHHCRFRFFHVNSQF